MCETPKKPQKRGTQIKKEKNAHKEKTKKANIIGKTKKINS
jgi:hypothetical protein